MRAIPIVIGAIIVLLIPLVILGVRAMSDRDLTGSFAPGGGAAVDSAARIEIEMLRQRLEGLDGKIETLEADVNALRTEISLLRSQDPDGANAFSPEAFERLGPNAIRDAYAQVVLIANRRNVNSGIGVASPGFLVDFLGRPREDLSDDCEPMTNPALRDKLVLEEVGPIRVRMLKPAAESLRRVFERIESADPDLYERISTAGALCVRRIRGTTDRVSTHAFGLAVDLNIDGVLDTLGDGKTQLGLTLLADFFNEEGWVWGAAFSREDSMHFEVSRQQLEAWRAEGQL